MSAPPAAFPVEVPTPPKPVTPAEAIPVEPAKALDPIAAEPTIFDKARDIAAPYLAKVEPYVEKAQAAAGPYVEKAQATAGEYAEKAATRTEEFINKVEARIEGATTPTTASTTASSDVVGGVPTSKSLADDPEILHPNAGIAGTAPTSSASTTTPTISEAGEKAKVFLGQGLSAVQSTFDKITHIVDEKTATPTHPGIITQVTNAVHKGVERVEGYLNEPSTATATDVPAGTTAVPASEPPVLTTTNTLPHAPIGL